MAVQWVKICCQRSCVTNVHCDIMQTNDVKMSGQSKIGDALARWVIIAVEIANKCIVLM